MVVSLLTVVGKPCSYSYHFSGSIWHRPTCDSLNVNGNGNQI